MADGENQYFSVRQYSQYNEDDQTGTLLTTINNGEVAYVSTGHAVVAELSAPDNVITTVQPSIVLNGTNYTTIELEEMGRTAIPPEGVQADKLGHHSPDCCRPDAAVCRQVHDSPGAGGLGRLPRDGKPLLCVRGNTAGAM